MYTLLRTILFLFDPEKVHYFSMNRLKMLCSFEWIKKLLTKRYAPPKSKNLITLPTVRQVQLFNLSFRNPVGLGAGFDKNALYLDELDVLGFGFVEIGTVTPLPQTGNDRPRLFRLTKDKALINRMGFNNDGAAVIANRLKAWKNEKELNAIHTPGPERHMIIGGNIGKNKSTSNESAWKDYEICFLALHDYIDYFTVNVSSPNTPGLRALQEKESLKKILVHLQQLNIKQLKPKPILLKIAPDLLQEELDDVISLAMEIKLNGLVVANTTTSREKLATNETIIKTIGSGGLSGLPCKDKCTEIIRYISGKTNGHLPIIASGGIFTSADACEKLKAGAVLVQVWTGFIYEGPSIVKNICTGLAKTTT